jgi:hypothetical protein
MALADFILRNMELILAEWEEFAGLLPGAAGMTPIGYAGLVEHLRLDRSLC